MEAFLKAIGSLPTWFTFVILACACLLMIVFTGSLVRTIAFDCGTIEIYGTNIGGHCVGKNYVSTSEWIEVSFADENGTIEPGVRGRSCTAVVAASMKKVFDDTLPINFNRSGHDRSQNLVWYKLGFKDILYDQLYQCRSNSVFIVTTGSASWPISSFSFEAVDRIADLKHCGQFLHRPPNLFEMSH